jgi:uncharacterized phage-associated protein
MTPGYNVRKAAHVAAYFAIKAGMTINVLKLTKLVYLADRRFLEQYDEPILFDQLVSMEHGPVDSTVYDLTKGELQSSDWDAVLTDRAGHEVGLRTPLTIDDLDQLSDAEIAVLDETWQRFGRMNQWQIRDYTHDHLREWIDPNKSSIPIPYSRLFHVLGRENSDELAGRIVHLIAIEEDIAKII